MLLGDMTATTHAPDGQSRRPAAAVPAPVRLAVLDSDSGFLQVLGKRLEAAGWQHRVLASPVPLDAIVAMRVNAIVIDLAVLGPQGWTYLEKPVDVRALPGRVADLLAPADRDGER